MENITMPLLGGALIGLSSTIMLLFLGRITGVSGILGTILESGRPSTDWRWFFLGGLVLGGIGLQGMVPGLFQYDFPGDTTLIVIAGLVVGFGTRLGSGCTSGHGVCGIPRFSARSLTATITFMIFGILTVTIGGYLS